MSSLNEAVEEIIKAIVSGLQSPPVPGLEQNAIEIQRKPDIFAGEIRLRVGHQQVAIGFCLHPHDYPSNFTLNGAFQENLPLNSDMQIKQSVKKISDHIRHLAQSD